MGNKLDKATQALAKLAARQHGVVSTEQLTRLGISRTTVTKWVHRGRLHRLHRGVYAVGHAAPSERQRFAAAVRACGEGAALSHGSAAVLWQFLKPLDGPVHVTSPSLNGRARQAGIALHRSSSLAERGETCWHEQIRVTSPRRTIEDLGRTLSPHLVRRAKRQAEFMGHRLALPSDRTRSDLESAFLAFCRRHRLLLPEVNVAVGGYTVDFLWPAAMLIVETDFFAYHRGSQAFEDDRQRDLDLRRLGYVVRRFTGAMIRDHPHLVVADLRESLAGETGARRRR